MIQIDRISDLQIQLTYGDDVYWITIGDFKVFIIFASLWKLE